MDQGFFASKYFIITAAIAAMIVGGAASAYYLGGEARGFTTHDACDAPLLRGTPMNVTPVHVVENDGRDRTETYTLDGSAYEGGAIKLCLSVGEILVEASPTDEVTLTIDTFSDVAAAVEQTRTEVSFHADGTGLVVGAWESARGHTRSWFDGDGASVRLVLRVPNSGAYDVELLNDVGDVRLSGLMVREPSFATDVGDIIVREIDATGNVTLTTDVGNAILHAVSVTTGTIRVSADVGNAEANLPQRADVGYDATAISDVGDAHIAIGDVEANTSEGDGAGESDTARSSGFASKPTRVVVHATADVGDARIVAS